MTDDNKTDDQKNVEALLKSSPATGQIGRLKGHATWSEPLSITEVGSLSAALFRPDQVTQFEDYQAAVAKLDDGKLLLLARGDVSPPEVGIQTELKPEVTQAYAGLELSKRKTAEKQEHEIKLARISARGPVWAKVLGWAGWILLVIVAGLGRI